MPQTPDTTLDLTMPITIDGVKGHLIGLKPWFDAAQDEGYGPAQWTRTIHDAVMSFQNLSRLRIVPSQIVMDDSEVYDGTFGVPNAPGLRKPLIVERMDRLPMWPDQAQQWWRMEVPANPIRHIQAVEFWLSGRVVYKVPTEWIAFDRVEGTLHLMPFWTNFTNVIQGLGAAVLLSGAMPDIGVPQATSITYIAGLPDNWDRLPQWAYMRPGLEKLAALEVLKRISEVFDPGLQGSSVNAFGLGQQLNYTRFANRKQELEADTQEFLKNVKPQQDFQFDFV